MSEIIIRYGQTMTEEMCKVISDFRDKHMQSCCKKGGVLELITRFNGPMSQFARCFICGEQIEIDNSDIL
jgi:hypothetical protein